MSKTLNTCIEGMIYVFPSKTGAQLTGAVVASLGKRHLLRLQEGSSVLFKLISTKELSAGAFFTTPRQAQDFVASRRAQLKGRLGAKYDPFPRVIGKPKSNQHVCDPEHQDDVDNRKTPIPR